MRITFLLSQDVESPSGRGRYLPWGIELARRGFRVRIIALHSNFAGVDHKRQWREGVEIIYVGQMHVRKVGSAKLYFPTWRLVPIIVWSTLMLIRAALTDQADLYHVGKPHPMNGLAGLLASWVRRRPLLVDCDDNEVASNRIEHGWQRWGLRLFEENLPRLAKRVTTNTTYTIERLGSLGVPRQNLMLLPNAIDAKRLTSRDPASIDALRTQLGLTPEEKVVLYVGSLSLASHPLDLLLEAFALVHTAGIPMRLVIVGGGEDLETLRRHSRELGIEKHTTFVGRVDYERVTDYYGLADVSVDPVRDDAAGRGRDPLKILESLAAGTPVVTAHIGERESLRMLGRQWIRLVAPGDAKALAEAVRDMLSGPPLTASDREQMWRDLPRWDVLANNVIALYQTVGRNA